MVVLWIAPTLLKSKDPDSAKDSCPNAITYVSCKVAPSLDDGLKNCEFLEEKHLVYTQIHVKKCIGSNQIDLSVRFFY